MGPSQIKIEDNINTVKVTTAQEMLEAVKESLPTDIAVCSAAVSDFRTDKFEQKIKKNNKDLNLKLYQNMDILSFISNHNNLRPKLVVGFAAETNDVLEYAAGKLERKQLNMIVANQVGDGKGFDKDSNQVDILTNSGEHISLPESSKQQLAFDILDVVCQFYFKEQPNKT